MYVLYYIVLFYIATIKLCLCALKCFKDHQKTLGMTNPRCCHGYLQDPQKASHFCKSLLEMCVLH